MNKLYCPEFAKVQEWQMALLKAQQESGIALVQRRDDDVYVARHADGREDELSFRDLEYNPPLE